jgi:hypothetical protein
LIGTILITIVIFMVIGATLALAPTHLASAASYTDSQRAQMAVEAGLNYARARLKEDLTWRGSPDSGPQETVRTVDESMVIVEDHGNVVGLIRFESGHYGQFRIRFNYQDGAGARDGMDNPSRPFIVDSEFVSENNLSGGTELDLLRDTRYSRRRPMDIAEDLVPRTTSVAPFQAYLAIEGRAGPGFRDADLDNPNDKPNGLRVVEKLAEVRLEADFSNTLDAAAMAAGDIDATLYKPRSAHGKKRGAHLYVNSKKAGGETTPPRIRSKGEVRAARADGASHVSLKSPGGFVNTGTGTLSSDTVPSESLQVQTEDPSSEFYSLEWDEVHHASADPRSEDTVNMKAGTYVLWERESDGKPELHYYDMGMEDYHTHMKDNPDDAGQVLSPNLEEARNNYSQMSGNQIYLRDARHSEPLGLHAQLLVNTDVRVESTGSTSEFNYIPKVGFIDGPPPEGMTSHPNVLESRPTHYNTNMSFQFVNHSGKKKITLSGDGDVTLNSRVHGNGGSITSEEDIQIVGLGMLDGLGLKDKGEGISLYSQGDVKINTYRPIGTADAGGSYNDMRLNGVLYAWGDIDFELAPPKDSNVSSDFHRRHGDLLVRGAVVAYGGDPGDSDNHQPGSGSGGVGDGKGNINITAHHANLTFDPKYLMSLEKLATPANMQVISWTFVPE